MTWVLLIFGLGIVSFLVVKIANLGILKKLIASFDNTTDGFSARKLSAFAGVVVSIIATFRFVDDKTIIEALIVWLVFALLCLGIVTAEQILRAYKGGDAQKSKITETIAQKVEGEAAADIKPEPLPKI